MSDKPTGQMKIVETELKDRTHAVYITIILEDGCGVRWRTQCSEFKFDLERVGP
jgi:hypothetical protein